jgi:hypothetical protein
MATSKPNDPLAASDRWAEDAKDPNHLKHDDQQKYQADADWIRQFFIP